jgi:parallel beta-helix repeat protein
MTFKHRTFTRYLERPEKTNYKYKTNLKNSNVLYVGGVGPNNYSKIQDAVNDASDGDMVYVYAGTYNENVLINRSIRLKGSNKNYTYINADCQDGIKITCDNVEISGFTIDIEKADNWDDSAIDVSSSNNYIHDNNIVNSNWYGIYVYNSSKNIIENNTFFDDDIAIWLCKSTDNIITNNNITFSDYVGVWLWHSSEDNIFNANNFIGNKVNVLNSDKKYINIWSGNYWDDYLGLKYPRLFDLNKDGIGFLKYKISRFESDKRPMIYPVEI